MGNYDANSIQSLNFRDGIRNRIEMYLGSADNQGVIQGIREIISNSIDEYVMGFGNLIEIDLFEGNRIQVRDYGRGCPFGEREDGTEALEAIFMTSHSGGKFNDKTYQSVIGMNGIGGKGVALSSLVFEVQSIRDGKKATLKLDKGLKTSFTVVADKKSKDGTFIEFIPDQEVYKLEAININFDEIKKMCKDWSYLNKSLKFKLTNHITKEEVIYQSSKGIIALLNDTIDTPVNKIPLYFEVTVGKTIMEVAVQWSKNRNEKGYIFTNGLHNVEGGTPVTGIRTAVTRTINKDFKTSFSGDAARVGLNYVVNIKIPNPSFANQTKTKVNNPELRALADRAFVEGWKEFNFAHPDEVARIKDYLTKEEKADKAAEKARSAVLNNTREIEAAQKKKTYNVDKLKDSIKHGPESILLLCEGKSASGALATARPVETVALYELRGKIINAKTNPLDKVLENAEVKDMITIIGAGFLEKFNPAKINFGKIGMAVDADAKQHWRKMLFA